MDQDPTPDEPDAEDPATSTEAPVEDAPGEDAPAESDWERRRRLAEIFGDVLPATTGDERDPGEGGKPRESAQDDWLRSQVPPHHGGH